MLKPTKKVILFGLSQTSSYAWYAFSHDSDYQVVAFTVDGAFSVITRDTEENQVFTPERARLRDFPADQMKRVVWQDHKQ